MSEKLCLKWNDFQDNVNAAFKSLQEDNEFADVTLACEDGQQIQAHKVILAACSPLFKNLLQRSKHPHPLIYLRGIKSVDLVAIVDFLYCGEANVYQENVDSFLAIAEELQLKGFLGQNNDQNTTPSFGTMETKVEPYISSWAKYLETDSVKPIKSFVKEQKSTTEINTCKIVAQNHLVSGDLQELDEKVKSLMRKGENQIPNGGQTTKVCKVCGKEGYATNIRDHIELNHLDGVAIPCKNCGNTFRSRCSLRKHKCKIEI